MCGFVVNNIYDIEKDRENHPTRPLPSGRISSTFASAIYFAFLAISLWLVRVYANESNVFLYLAFVVAMVNYNLAIVYFPYLKNLYVAAAGLIPVFILLTLIHVAPSRAYVMCALFLYLLGKEMLTDIIDAKGDGRTLVKRIGLQRAENVAFGLKLLSDAVLLIDRVDLVGVLLAVGFLSSDVVCLLLWKFKLHKSAVIVVMKLQAVVGIYYLI